MIVNLTPVFSSLGDGSRSSQTGDQEAVLNNRFQVSAQMATAQFQFLHLFHVQSMLLNTESRKYIPLFEVGFRADVNLKVMPGGTSHCKLML